MGRIIACKSSELESGKMKKVSVDSKEILVANVNGNYFACDDTCTHSGASLSEGKLEIQPLRVDGMRHNLIAKQVKWKNFPQRLTI